MYSNFDVEKMCILEFGNTKEQIHKMLRSYAKRKAQDSRAYQKRKIRKQSMQHEKKDPSPSVSPQQSLSE